MAAPKVAVFSPNGEYLAYSTPDGTLKLWGTTAGALKQEYTPSSHLSATCSCISWNHAQQVTDSPKKKRKKRRSSISEDVSSGYDLIALGTTSGSILIYSLLKGDLHTQLNDGHTDTVHGISWHPDGDRLYSCSADKHIIEWDLRTGTPTHKWKADKGSVHSLALCESKQYLLSAGRTIKVWDLETRTVIRTYSGHATEVFQLLPLPSGSCGAVGAEGEATVPSMYFLSAATDDRHLHAWHVNPASKDKNSVASFALSDEPIQMCLRMQPQEQRIVMGAVTRSGQLLLFEHVLNGFQKKPLKPKSVVQLATECQREDTPHPIPVLAAHLHDDVDQAITIAHGIFLRPTFEKILYRTLENNVCLVRKDPHISVMQATGAVSKVRTPEVSNDLTVLTPGHMLPSKPSQDSQPGPSKRKRKKSMTGEMSLDERLNAISIDKPSTSSRGNGPPRADTLATLLSQGLQSQDKKILNSVLQHSNESIIRNTVRRLPVPVIVPLVKELSRRMHGHSQGGHTLVKWLKMVLTIHTSFLMTFPELVEMMGGMYQMMDSRVSLFSRLSKLQGKLDLMLSQISSQTVDEDETVTQQPMLVYQDDSSEEDDEGDLVADSASEDNWDESDMEMERDEDEEEEEEADGDGVDDGDDTSSSDSESVNGNDDVKTNGADDSDSDAMSED